MQEYDVEPAVEFAADLPEMGGAGEARRLEQCDYGRRLAAAAADERVVPDREGARDKIGQQGAADPVAAPFGVDVEGELGRVPVGGAERIEQALMERIQ